MYSVVAELEGNRQVLIHSVMCVYVVQIPNGHMCSTTCILCKLHLIQLILKLIPVVHTASE